MMILIK